MSKRAPAPHAAKAEKQGQRQARGVGRSQSAPDGSEPAAVKWGADVRNDGKPHKVMFRVYRRYFDELEAGTKNIEFRDAKRPWLSYLDSQPSVAVFTSGRRRLERQILGVAYWQGKVEFHLGPAIPPRKRGD